MNKVTRRGIGKRLFNRALIMERFTLHCEAFKKSGQKKCPKTTTFLCISLNELDKTEKILRLPKNQSNYQKITFNKKVLKRSTHSLLCNSWIQFTKQQKTPIVNKRDQLVCF